MRQILASAVFAMVCAPAHAERLDTGLALTLSGPCAVIAYHNSGEPTGFYARLADTGFGSAIIPSALQREIAQASACRAPRNWNAGIGVLYDQRFSKRFSWPFVALQYRTALNLRWDCKLTGGLTDMWNRRREYPPQPTTIHAGRFYPFFTIQFEYRF